MAEEQSFQTLIILGMATALFIWALLRNQQRRQQRKRHEVYHRGKPQATTLDRLFMSFLITLIICAGGYIAIIIGEPILSNYLEPDQVMIVGFITVFIVLMTVIYILLEISGWGED